MSVRPTAFWISAAMNSLLVALSSFWAFAACQETQPVPSSMQTRRSLSFPDSHSLGTLHVLPTGEQTINELKDSGAIEGFENWTLLGPARGTVEIPENVVVRLELSEDGCRDLSGLTRLPPDAIQSVLSSSKSLTDEQFEYINSQTGLLHLQIDFSQCTDRSLEHMRPLKNLIAIRWSNYFLRKDGFGFTDASADVWTSFPDLRLLYLQEHDVGDMTCASLSQLAKLKSLSLIDSKATDAGMKDITKLPALESLVLGSIENGTPITDTGLETICQIDTLKELVISASDISGQGLAHLAGLPNLETLRMDWVNVSNDDLAHLEPLRNLTWLRYSGVNFGPIDDTGALHLSKLPNLERITGSWELTNEGYRHLAKLQKLESLDLRADVEPEALQAIAKMQGLRRLTIQNCELSDAAIAEIARHPTIDGLLLNNLPITSEALRHIGQMKSLRRLRIMNHGKCNGLEQGFHHLSGLTNLTDISLFAIDLDRRHWPVFRNFTKLERITIEATHDPIRRELLDELTECKQLDMLTLNPTTFDDGVMPQLQQFPNLRFLRLACIATDKGLESLTNLAHLNYVTIMSPSVSAKAEEALRRGSASLRSVSVEPRSSRSYSFNGDGLLQIEGGLVRIEHDFMQTNPAPQVTLAPLQHLLPTFTLDDAAGKIVVVAFLEKGSRRSDIDASHLKRLYSEFKEQDVELLSIYRDGDPDDIKADLVARDIQWPCGIDVGGRTVRAWHVVSVPTYFVLNRDGTVEFAGLHRSDLATAINKLLEASK